MAFTSTDPRSQLDPGPAGRSVGANVAPQYFEFDQLAEPELSELGSRTWWVRSQTCVVGFSRVVAGDTLGRTGQPDEYLMLLPDADRRAVVRSGPSVDGPDDRDETVVVGRSVVVVPPGDSSITVDDDVTVVRMFSNRSSDLCRLTLNEHFYDRADPNVAPFEPWPAPVDGHRVRVYPVDDVAPSPDRFGRIYRCSTLMVNWFYEDPGPRDPTKLSPHHHDDFEQLSLQLAGEYVHHLRTPWTVDLDAWRDDEHQRCESPAVTVIPPPAIHTSQGVGDTPHQLIDIFCPPRLDFSARPGWVLNADEYPVGG